MLNISNYTKVYPGGKTAVDGLTLHVAPGEICGFIGHNGAGKTTTLRAVVGVMSFTQGTITIGGSPPGTGRRASGSTRTPSASLGIWAAPSPATPTA